MTYFTGWTKCLEQVDDVNKNENLGKVSHAMSSQADIPLLANACLILQVEKQMGSKDTRGKTTAKEGRATNQERNHTSNKTTNTKRESPEGE